MPPLGPFQKPSRLVDEVHEDAGVSQADLFQPREIRAVDGQHHAFQGGEYRGIEETRRDYDVVFHKRRDAYTT